jgi:hypothetical protein
VLDSPFLNSVPWTGPCLTLHSLQRTRPPAHPLLRGSMHLQMRGPPTISQKWPRPAEPGRRDDGRRPSARHPGSVMEWRNGQSLQGRAGSRRGARRAVRHARVWWSGHRRWSVQEPPLATPSDRGYAHPHIRSAYSLDAGRTLVTKVPPRQASERVGSGRQMTRHHGAPKREGPFQRSAAGETEPAARRGIVSRPLAPALARRRRFSATLAFALLGVAARPGSVLHPRWPRRPDPASARAGTSACLTTSTS